MTNTTLEQAVAEALKEYYHENKYKDYYFRTNKFTTKEEKAKNTQDAWLGMACVAISAMQVREMSVEDVAQVLFESRYPCSWEIASKRVLNQNLYAEADQCRRDAKVLAKLGTIRITGGGE